MSEVKYMNVWRNHDGSYQWTDVEIWETAISDRDFVDGVANDLVNGDYGIYRMAVLRIRAKSEHAKD